MEPEMTIDDLLKRMEKMKENIKKFADEDFANDKEEVSELLEESKAWKAEAKAAQDQAKKNDQSTR